MATQTIPAKDGHKAISFHKGGLHESTHTPAGQKIPASKRRAALMGSYGATTKRQALFAKNILHH